MLTEMEGRNQLDVCMSLRREKKLRSYTLNAVSEKFLGERKVDMDYSRINELQESPEGRSILAYYCSHDTVLPWKLTTKLKLIVNYVQMAYVAGVSVDQLLYRGQQLRMLAQVYHYVKDTESNPIPDGSQRQRLSVPYMVPVHPTYQKFPTEKYEGAVCINPKKGLHEEPVTTGDFSSLYPSIIIAHNLCWSTHVTEEQIAKGNLVEDVHYKRIRDYVLQDDDLTVVEVYNPKNPCFLLEKDTVTDEIVAKYNLKEGIHYTRDANGTRHLVACKRGVLPTLLVGLLTKRKEVKAASRLLDGCMCSKRFPGAKGG